TSSCSSASTFSFAGFRCGRNKGIHLIRRADPCCRIARSLAARQLPSAALESGTSTPDGAGMSPRDAALELARRLSAAGHEAVFAGGCVRDRLLGRVPEDYDIATSATPAEVLALFPGANEVGAHFGVVIAKHQGHHVEIATFRTD